MEVGQFLSLHNGIHAVAVAASRETQPELLDLDKDGISEILVRASVQL